MRRSISTLAILGAAAALVVVLLSGVLQADDTTIQVLGTGSPTGAVTAPSPHATAVGKWISVKGGKESGDVVTFQLTGGAGATVVIQTSMDKVEIDTPYTFPATGRIYDIPVRGGVIYRAVATGFSSGDPVVLASASGKAQLEFLP